MYNDKLLDLKFPFCWMLATGFKEIELFSFRFHGSPGTKSFSSSITLVYLPESMWFTDFIVANKV